MPADYYVLTPTVSITDCPSEVFSVRFDPEGKLLATGCADGAVRVFNTNTGRLVYTLNSGSTDAMPTTSVRFRPVSAASKTKNVVIAANASGSIQHWHVTSGKMLHSIVDSTNELYAVDYRPDGAFFATAGKDKLVRLYDEATKTLMATMGGVSLGGYNNNSGQLGSTSHSNRVFSLKFSPTDDNLLASGGWDNTVQVEHAVRYLYGPHLCGDAMDIAGNTIVTGSWRPEDVLETWDFGTGKLVESIPWNQSAFQGQACMLYAAQFSKEHGNQFIGAGGSGANEAKIFDRANGNKLVGSITGLSRGVFTLDFAANNRFAIAGGDGAIRVIEITKASDVDGGNSVIDCSSEAKAPDPPSEDKISRHFADEKK